MLLVASSGGLFTVYGVWPSSSEGPFSIQSRMTVKLAAAPCAAAEGVKVMPVKVHAPAPGSAPCGLDWAWVQEPLAAEAYVKVPPAPERVIVFKDQST